MSTLTETASLTRKALLYGGIAFSIFFILFLTLRAFISWWQVTHPPKPLPPDVRFGELPALKFPQTQIQLKLNYKLETIDGVLPKLQDIAKVYSVPKPVRNLLSLSKSREFAARLGFKNEPNEIMQNVYQWNDPQYPRVLKRDVVSGNFIFTYDYVNDFSVFTEKNLPTAREAISEARSTLQGLGIYDSSFNGGRADTSFWKFSGGKLVPALSFSEANAIRVDLFLNDIDGLPVLPAGYKKAPVYFILSGTRSTEKRILELHYTFWPINKDDFATYPLKTSQEAWDELQAVKGYIASLGGVTKQAVIRSVTLAYFNLEDYQPYFQPIYVFEGDSDFAAYVPAISSQWVTENR